MAESLNSFDSGLDQGSTFGVEPELVYECLQTNTQPVKESSISETIPETQATAALACGGKFAFTSVEDTQCSSTFSEAGLHLTLGTADKPRMHI